MRRAPTLAAPIAVILIASLAPIAALAQGRPAVRVARLASATPDGAHRIGTVAADRVMPVTVALAPPDPGAVTTVLRDLYDPSSPIYHHWLSRGEFVARFGPTAAERTDVTNWLKRAGATDVRTFGFAVHADLTATRLSTAVDSQLVRYRLPSGHVGFRAQRAPLLPLTIADDVQAILGLDTLSTAAHPLRHGAPQRRTDGRARFSAGTAASSSDSAEPHVQFDGLTACGTAQQVANQGYYTFNELGAAYGVGSLLSAGQTGHGQTIGVYELSPHSAADTGAYKSCFGLTTPLTTVAVDSGGSSSANGTVEADVDIEQAATQAPAASVISYEGPNSATGQYDTWYSIVSSDVAQVVSTSWGTCEPNAAAAGVMPSFGALFQQAAAQGQTILAAAGDSGSEDCFRGAASTAEQVDYPASDPWVTAVGGTSLFSPSNETTWNDCQSSETVTCATNASGVAAGGGGMSRYEARPAFQPNVLAWPDATQPCGNIACREVPDISANAGVGMVDYAGGGWSAVGGTSLSAPFIAGLVADKNNGCTTRTGRWTPALYALAAQGVYGTALNDITVGDNDMTGSHAGAYPAASGYDAATGIGSPRAAGLACPEVFSVTPSAASPGATLSVTGLGLEKASFFFGSTPAAVSARTPTSASVVVPTGAGAVAVSAQSAMGAGTQTAPFTFGSTLQATSGAGQHSISGSPFTHALVATLTGSDGQPAAGVTVNFTVGKPGAAAFPSGQTSVGVVTGADGTATSPVLTAGPTAGSFTVTASSAGIATPASFALSTLPKTADLAVTVSGGKDVARGKHVVERVTITNNGPASATALMTSLKAPPPIQVIKARGSTRHGSRWTWSLAALAPGASHSYVVKLKAKGHHHGTASISLKTSSGVADPRPSNNKHKVKLHLG